MIMVSKWYTQGLVREVYKSLLEDEEDFDGFDLKYANLL